MNLNARARWLCFVLLFSALPAGGSPAQGLGGMFQMIGGMDAVKKLSSKLLESSASDPRLSGLLAKADTGAMAPKLADQICSMLGGSCKPPLTDAQIAEGATKVDASQTKALGENFGSALGSVVSNPMVKEGVSKMIAPKLGGIIGALV